MQRSYSREDARRGKEVVFIDPAVSEIADILQNLRPGVEPILLDASHPAALQMADALAGRRDLHAIHILAHGAPGEVHFASDSWTADALNDHGPEFAAIGAAMGQNGDLRLWCCSSGGGTAGDNLFAALAKRTGVRVAAASGPIGAASLGGVWTLDKGAATAGAPLSPAGLAGYPSLLNSKTWSAGSGNWSNPANWSPSGAPAVGDDVLIQSTGTFTVTLDVDTALHSLTIQNPNATLAMGAQEIGWLPGNGSMEVAGGTITLAGGGLDGPIGLIAGSVRGFGNLGNVGGGTVMASGGVLSLLGVSNVHLAIDTLPGSTLEVGYEGTGISDFVTLNNASQTLEINRPTFTLSGGLTASDGKVVIRGGTLKTGGAISLSGDANLELSAGGLNSSAGISVTGSAILQGAGKVLSLLSGTGTVRASGGTLMLANGSTGGLSFQVGSGATDTLQILAASSAASASFLGSTGILEIANTGSLTLTKALAIGSNTVKLDGSASTLTDSAGLTLAGGTISGAGKLRASTNLQGFGTVGIPLSGSTAVTAAGGTLDVQGKVAGGKAALSIGSGATDRLKISSAARAASASFLGSTGTLEIGSTGSLSLTKPMTIGANILQLDAPASTLSDTGGVSLGGGGITGQGTLSTSTPVSGTGYVTASGGTLKVLGSTSGGLTLQVGHAVGDRLVLGASGGATTVKFLGSSGILELGSASGLILKNAMAIGTNTLQLDGSFAPLIDPAGVTLAGGTVTGHGTLAAQTALSGNGTVMASGGTLQMLGSISGGLDLQIGTGATDTLKLGAASSAASASFLGSTGVLEITYAGRLTLANALAIGKNTVRLEAASSTLTDSAGITLAGGNITGQGHLGPDTDLQGFGDVNVALSGGTITASGGALDLANTVGGTTTLQIGKGASDKLVLGRGSNTATASFLGSTGVLEIGSSASLTLSNTMAIGTNTVLLDGTSSILADAAGVTLAGGTISGAGRLTSSTGLVGYGTLSQVLYSGGVVRASGGMLDITSNITATNVTGLQIDNNNVAALQLNGTVAAGDRVKFLGGRGALDLTHFSNPGTSNAVLTGFNASISGLTVSTSFAAPSGNYIDLTELRVANIASATLNTTTDVVTVKNTGGSSFTLQLAGSYTTGTQVKWTADGAGGSKLFLAPAFGSNTLTVVNKSGAASTSDTWTNSTSWSGATPSATPAAGTTLAFTETGNTNLGNVTAITMPATLRQATGSGTTRWTVADTATLADTSALTLVNQGQIFVNATNDFTAVTGSTSNNWTLTGATVSAANQSTMGRQIFENDGALNIIGTAGTGSTTATFSAGNTNLSVTGSGRINLYGSAHLTIGANVGVGAQQTINFIGANGHSNGVVTEVSALGVAAEFGGFRAGDKVALQNLGGAPTSESVVDSNGLATVSISVGSKVVDTVTFLGKFTHGAADFTFTPSASNGGMLTIGSTISAGLAAASVNTNRSMKAMTGSAALGVSAPPDLNKLVAESFSSQVSALLHDGFGSNPSAAEGLKRDSKLDQLISAMATFSAHNPGFDTTTPGAANPGDPILQGAISAAWHH
jgi:hypothetical protein